MLKRCHTGRKQLSMLAPQMVFACQIMISTTDLLKRKASKYVLATFKRQKPTKCPTGGEGGTGGGESKATFIYSLHIKSMKHL